MCWLLSLLLRCCPGWSMPRLPWAAWILRQVWRWQWYLYISYRCMYSCTALHCSALYRCTEPVTDLALALMLRSGTDSERPPRWLSGEMHLWFLKWTLKHAVHEVKLKIEVFLGFWVKISLFLAVQDWSLTFTKCFSNIIFILQAEVVDSIDIGAPAAVWEVDINPVTQLQVGMVPSKKIT